MARNPKLREKVKLLCTTKQNKTKTKTKTKTKQNKQEFEGGRIERRGEEKLNRTN